VPIRSIKLAPEQDASIERMVRSGDHDEVDAADLDGYFDALTGSTPG